LNIVETTQVAEPIKVAPLSSSSSTGQSTSDDESRNSEDKPSKLGQQWVDGSAIKFSVKKWEVFVSNGDRFKVNEENLLIF
jgi:hypothetical protein